MARPRIGIFGALVAVGGLLAWRWAQKHRASQAHLNRDLSRWEDEGGAVSTLLKLLRRPRVRRARPPPPVQTARAIQTDSVKHGRFRTAEPHTPRASCLGCCQKGRSWV
jgi:hypothetical protein